MLHKKQKALTQTHKKPRTNTTHQASQAHELRKGRAASPHSPFAIRGAWGDFVPPQKNLDRRGGTLSPHKKKSSLDEHGLVVTEHHEIARPCVAFLDGLSRQFTDDPVGKPGAACIRQGIAASKSRVNLHQ